MRRDGHTLAVWQISDGPVAGVSDGQSGRLQVPALCQPSLQKGPQEISQPARIPGAEDYQTIP